MSNPTFMICLKADRPPSVDHSSRQTCHFCSCEVWVSPASFEQATEHAAVFVCPPCGLEKMKAVKDKKGEITIGGPSTEMAIELAQTLSNKEH